MAKLVKTQFESANRFLADYELDNKEYTTLKDKTIDKLVNEVEVKGFRKGKAPKQKALAQINPSILAQTIMQNVIEEYSTKAIDEAAKQLKKDDRVITNVDLDYDSEYTGEIKDGGFKMRIVMNLFPKIDLKNLDKIKIEEPTLKDITDLPKKADFKQNEIDKLLREQNEFVESKSTKAVKGNEVTVDMEGTVNGKKHDGLNSKSMKVVLGAGMFLPVFEKELMGAKVGDIKEFDLPFPKDYTPELAGKTAQVKVTVKSIGEPKYKTIEDMVANHETLKQHYPDMKKFDEDIERVYQARVDQLLDSIARKRVVDQVLKEVPDFEIDKNLQASEADRILHAMKHEADHKKQTLAEVLADSGLSSKDPKKLAKFSDEEVKKEVTEYVGREIKLTNILSFIFETKLPNKPEPQEVRKIIEEAEKNKATYQIPEDATHDQVRNIMNDRVIRQYAGNWLVEQVLNNSKPTKKVEKKK